MFLALRPGTLDDVIDLKLYLVTVILIGAIVQVCTMALVYGWVPSPKAWAANLSGIHRWEGRGLALLAVIVSTFCILDPGPQGAPQRVYIHSTFGIVVLALLASKIVVLKAVPKLQVALPAFGLLVAGSFGVLWYTSAYAFWFQGTKGYSGHAEIDATVQIVNDDKTVGAYNPAEVKVKKGHAIEWENASDDRHTVTGGKFDSGPRGFSKGDKFVWQFNTVGRIEYKCSIHPVMKAVVVVEE